jgi:hypothetical protein
MAAGGLAMSLRAIVSRTRYWQGLMLGLAIVAMINLNDATTAAGDKEPWPELLWDVSPNVDQDYAALHQRAVASLEHLTQGAGEDDPL